MSLCSNGNQTIVFHWEPLIFTRNSCITDLRANIEIYLYTYNVFAIHTK